MSAALLIRGAELPGRGIRDLRLAGGRIEAIAPRLDAGGARVIEAGGNALIAGLHDHHLHLYATAAARGSLACGPPEVNDAEQLRRALLACPLRDDGWIRGVGFHDSVAPLDRDWLDGVCPQRPVRIQHRSGMLWVLNSRALEQLRLDAGEALPAGAERASDGRLTGRFYALDGWLGARLPSRRPGLRELSAELARHGITGVTDAGARNGRAEWECLRAAQASGEFAQRLFVMGSEELEAVVPAPDARIAVGPLKIYLREAGLPELDRLEARVRGAHAQGRAVAFHCVTRTELVFALAALRAAGTRGGDRIEHASIADDAAIEELAVLGVTVVTQPHFITERGTQYLRDVDHADHALLYRGASFLRGGARLAAGSDAPYGSIDPWCAMRAALSRRTRGGELLGVAEALSAAEALALFGGEPAAPGGGLRELRAGQWADLCLLDVPWDIAGRDLDASHVALTLCAGAIAFASSDRSRTLAPGIR